MSDADPRIVDRTERNAATSFRDHAAGPPVKAEAVTGRPNDLSGKVVNSTFADRRKAAQPQRKAVASDEAEDKAVKPSAVRAKRV